MFKNQVPKPKTKQEAICQKIGQIQTAALLQKPTNQPAKPKGCFNPNIPPKHQKKKEQELKCFPSKALAT